MAVVGLNGVLDTSTTSDYTVVFAASGATTNYVSGGENYYTYKAVVNGEIVNAYEATSAQSVRQGAETYYVDSFDDGRADGVVGGRRRDHPHRQDWTALPALSWRTIPCLCSPPLPILVTPSIVRLC